MEEELPPGFWEEAQEPHPPSTAQQRQVKAQPDRPPREEVSASGRQGPSGDEKRQAGRGPRRAGASSDRGQGEGGAADDVQTLEDPGFETLRALFPGRIVSIEESEAAETEEEVSPAAGGREAAGSDDEDEAGKNRQE